MTDAEGERQVVFDTMSALTAIAVASTLIGHFEQSAFFIAVPAWILATFLFEVNSKMEPQSNLNNRNRIRP